MGDYVTKRIPILKGQNTPVTTGTGGTPTATTPATTGGTTGTTGTGTTAATTGTATNTTFKEKTPEELAKMSMAERMSYDHQKQLHQQNQKKTQTVSSQDGSITSMHPVASSSGRTLKQGETIVDVMSADAKAATSHTPAPAEVTGQFSGRVDSDTNEYLRKAEQSRNRNRLTQLFAADLQRRMGNQFADKIRNNLLMNRVVSPNLS